MLLLDPILSGVPATVFVDAAPTAIAAPTATMLADTRTIFRENVAPYRWYRSNGSVLVEVGSGTPGTLTNIVYTGGVVTSCTVNGITFTYTYLTDGTGRVSSIIGGGVTRTVNYNVDGSIASVT